MATVLLLGFDDQSAATLAKLSLDAGHVPRREAMRTTFETRPDAQIVFVSGDQSAYQGALASLRSFRDAPPVVVISRLGESSGWIEALEAGATDFISAPFRQEQISSLIEAATSRQRSATA